MSKDYTYIFNDESLDDFLREFDAVSKKFDISSKFRTYNNAFEFDKIFEPIDYTKKDNFSFIENMCMVYGYNQSEANDFLWRYKTTLEKLINQFVHIKSLSRLFNEQYVEFEWDMHSRMDFNEHKISYYRDHFFHQLRDCIMVLKLLDDERVFDKVSQTLQNATISKVSQYFSVTLERLIYNIRDNHQLRAIIAQKIKEKKWQGLSNDIKNIIKKYKNNITCTSEELWDVIDFCFSGHIEDPVPYFVLNGQFRESLVNEIKSYIILNNDIIQTIEKKISSNFTLKISHRICNEIIHKIDAFFWKSNNNYEELEHKIIKMLDEYPVDETSEYLDTESSQVYDAEDDCINYILDALKEGFAKILVDDIFKVVIPEFGSSRDDKNEIRDYFCRYIIFSTAIIASLFHDIGYPVVHYFKLQKRLQSFSPPIYMLISGDKSSYEKIAATLSQSLLFQIVSKNEIFERCEKGDHGTFSSIILLLHFYESGLIFSLALEQRTAIELAAVAIYNHTNKYQYVLGDKKRDECQYYRPIFKLNPISFLLRVCDDAQEWKRTYFEICDAPSLIYCKKCNTPLMREKDGQDYVYCCRCSDDAKLEPTFYKQQSTDFKRRIIYNVCPSDSLEINTATDKTLSFKFDYDYFWLLRMCTVSTSYAFQRTRELNYIKKIVNGQDIGYSLAINFRMSYNPILLKSWIIGEYMGKNKSIKDIFTEVPIKNAKLKKRLRKQLDFYDKINSVGCNLKENDNILNKTDQIMTKLSLQTSDGCSDYSIEIIRNMTYDALMQYYKEIYCMTGDDYLEKHMVSDKTLLFDVNYYCDTSNPINKLPADILYPDYYSDLRLFECMNQ